MVRSHFVFLNNAVTEFTHMRDLFTELEIHSGDKIPGLVILGFNGKHIEDELYLNHLVRIRHLTGWHLLVMLNTTEQEVFTRVESIGTGIKALSRPPGLTQFYQALTEMFHVVSLRQ
jgi:hypothetical protein